MKNPKVKVTPIDKPIVENTSFKFKKSPKTKNIFKELDKVHKYTRELYNTGLFVLKQVNYELYGKHKVDKVDEKGNTVYKLKTKKDQNGQWVPDLDKNGDQKYYLDAKGNKVSQKVEAKKETWTKKEEEEYQELINEIRLLEKQIKNNKDVDLTKSNKKQKETAVKKLKELNKDRYKKGHPGHIKNNYPELFKLIKFCEEKKSKTKIDEKGEKININKTILNPKGELVKGLPKGFLNTIVRGFENKEYNEKLSSIIRINVLNGLEAKFQGTWDKIIKGDREANFPKYINEPGENERWKLKDKHQVSILFSGVGKFSIKDGKLLLPLWSAKEKSNHSDLKIPFPKWRDSVSGSIKSVNAALKNTREKISENQTELYNYINSITISFINKNYIKVTLTTIDKSKHNTTDNVIKNVVAVDPGLRQWITSFDSNGNKLVLSEKTLRNYKENVNYRNSKIKKLQQQLPYKIKGIPENERKTPEQIAKSVYETKKIQTQRVKLENYKETFLNQIAKEIVKFWKKCEVNLVYLPSIEKITQELKQKANENRAKNKEGGYGGKTINRQVSQNTPIGRLFDILVDKCTREQITTVRNVSEWFTSKACFVNLDKIKKGTDFSGTRVKENYLTKLNNKDVVVDSDINGAANILRKSLSEVKLSEHLDTPINKKTINKILSDLENLTQKERFEILSDNKNTLKLNLENNNKPKIKKKLKEVKKKKEISR